LGKRRKAREIVLQALYELEFSDRTGEEILEDQVGRRLSSAETVDYARDLFRRTVEHLDDLDRRIAAALQNWELARVSIIDKNILRFALAEILFFPHVPSKVIINEAIEIAHKYSSKDAGRFVNGILDRFVGQYRRESD
jgi:transcription antitermination factor NusB